MTRRLTSAQVAELAAQPENRTLFISRGHGPSCDLIVTGRCTCAPTYTVGPLTPEAVKAATESMQQWRRERLS